MAFHRAFGARRGVATHPPGSSTALGMTMGLIALALVGCTATAPSSGIRPAQDQGPVRGGTMSMVVLNGPIDVDPNFGGRANPGEDGMAVAYNSLLSFKFGPEVQYTDMQLA